MDKEWMRAPRYTVEYEQGLQKFMDFALANSAKSNEILCPCKKCWNRYWLTEQIVREHLICDGFMPGYIIWIHHGEGLQSCQNDGSPTQKGQEVEDDEIDSMLREGLGFHDIDNIDVDGTDCEVDTKTYYRLANDASQPLYPGCKRFSKLQFVVRLLNVKSLWGVSNDCFTKLLTLFKEALPPSDEDTLPKNFHEARKFVKIVGVDYENIDACPNDCILYRKEYADATFCPVCGTSRWKSERTGLDGKRVHKVPQKVLRHFPLKRRLQRLFMSSKTAADMRWHSEERTKDDLLRHPADSTAWKDFDYRHPQFSSDNRNVRLGLATDGFNPFRTMNVSYTTWPVILMPYNLPPWVCMKQSNFILSLLIPGPTSPGNDIDVYLQPLIDELRELWDKGVRTYDASLSQWFQLQAALIWTISDYPGYAYLSGWSTSGKFACANCHSGTCSLWLKNGRKTCYMGHRRFLDIDHKFRREANSFDGTQEFRDADNT